MKRVFIFALCLFSGVVSTSFAASSSSSSKDDDAKPEKTSFICREAKLWGVSSLKINNDDSVTVYQTQQSSLAGSFTSELRDGKGMKKRFVTAKEGESFTVTNGNFAKYIYTVEKVNESNAVFSVHSQFKTSDRKNTDENDWRCRVEPYGDKK